MRCAGRTLFDKTDFLLAGKVNGKLLMKTLGLHIIVIELSHYMFNYHN